MSLGRTRAPQTADNGQPLQKVHRKVNERETLRAVSHVIGSTLDLHELARRITREAARAVDADSAGIYIEDDHALRPLAGYRIPKEFLDRIRAKAFFHPNEPRPCRFLLEPSKILWSDDVPNDPAFCHEVFRSFPVQSILVTPLLAVDRWIGVLVCVWWTRRRRLAPDEVRLIDGIAAQAAQALISARVFAKADAAAVQRERRRMDGILHDMLNQTLFSIALRIELSLHELRVSELRDKLQAIRQDVGVMMGQIRQLLVPADEGAATFSARLQRLLDDFENVTGIPTEFIQDGETGRLGLARQEILQKTLEESLAGIAKREPRRVVVRLALWTDEVLFELADEGASVFAGVERLTEPPPECGLNHTVERIKSLGGSMEFWSRLPSGLRLRAKLPLP